VNANILVSGSIILLVVLIVGVVTIAGLFFALRRRSERLKKHFGSEYDHTVEVMGDVGKAQTELEDRQKHVAALDIQPLSASDNARYQTEWAAVQSKFVDEPGQAIVEANRLIMEVMQVRAYPVSDFEQRASDLSVNYPDFVSNYRAARVIALKNKENQADTEELRQAIIYYRSLFEQLLEKETIAV